VRPRAAIPLLLVLAGGLYVWRAELFSVARPGEGPRPLVAAAERERPPAAFDVALPAVPVGMQQLRSGDAVLLIHYWAPWQRHARDQAHSLDSLRREPDLEGLRVVVVCFDPFPSVSRFVARQRLRLPVLLDGPGELRRVLPCPSIPYTYVVDRAGRIAVTQPGEVDWWAEGTRTALRGLLEEGRPEDQSPQGAAPASLELGAPSHPIHGNRWMPTEPGCRRQIEG